MTILWLLFLLHAVYAGKITEEENLELKKRCSKSAVRADMYKRFRVDQSKYPFAVAVSINDGKSPSEPSCSGVLISPRHILTAAHCLLLDDAEKACKQMSQGHLHLRSFPARYLGVFYQSSCSTLKCWTNRQQVYKVAIAHINRDFVNMDEVCKNSSSYDIAMIELEENVTSPPICMPQEDDIIPQKAMSIGYGKYEKQQTMRAVKYDRVMEYSERKFTLVAYTKHKNESAVFGDSGGPLLQELHGKHYLVGITSTTTKPEKPEPGFPVVGSKFVDVRKHLKWICDETGEYCHNIAKR